MFEIFFLIKISNILLNLYLYFRSDACKSHFFFLFLLFLKLIFCFDFFLFSKTKTHYCQFNTNNVDASVSANVLYGLTVQQLSGLVLDATQLSLYVDTARLIAFVFDSKADLLHPDMAFLYYPARRFFYWSAARTLRAIESANKTNSAMKEVRI